jgi:recombination protein U
VLPDRGVVVTRAVARRTSRNGRASQALGEAAEALVQRHLDACERAGVARVRKLPTPMRVVGRAKTGMLAIFTERAEPDYAGVLRGGRAVVCEAKYTAAPSLPLSRVAPHQRVALERAEALGALALLLVVFQGPRGRELYAVPWEWADAGASLTPAECAAWRCDLTDPFLGRWT